jgi:hypothetical protein
VPICIEKLPQDARRDHIHRIISAALPDPAIGKIP